MRFVQALSIFPRFFSAQHVRIMLQIFCFPCRSFVFRADLLFSVQIFCFLVIKMQFCFSFPLFPRALQLFAAFL